MSRRAWFAALAAGSAALLFAWAHRGESLVLHLGLLTWYRAPVTLVVLGAFLLGMAAMFLVGLFAEGDERRERVERLPQAPARATAPEVPPREPPAPTWPPAGAAEPPP